MKLVAAICLLEVKVAQLFGLATFWLDCNITAGDTQLNTQAWLRTFMTPPIRRKVAIWK